VVSDERRGRIKSKVGLKNLRGVALGAFFDISGQHHGFGRDPLSASQALRL
jgi:hypothetical protein